MGYEEFATGAEVLEVLVLVDLVVDEELAGVLQFLLDFVVVLLVVEFDPEVCVVAVGLVGFVHENLIKREIRC